MDSMTRTFLESSSSSAGGADASEVARLRDRLNKIRTAVSKWANELEGDLRTMQGDLDQMVSEVSGT